MFVETPMFVAIFCLMFKQILTKPQRRHVGLFLTQRMVGSPKNQTISKIRKLFLNAPSTNASANFLNTPTMAWKMIKERRKEIISSKFKSKKGAIIVDDTFCYKTGKKMKGIFWSEPLKVDK